MKTPEAISLRVFESFETFRFSEILIESMKKIARPSSLKKKSQKKTVFIKKLPARLRLVLKLDSFCCKVVGFQAHTMAFVSSAAEAAHETNQDSRA